VPALTDVFTPPVLIATYALVVVVCARFAAIRGRSSWRWLLVAMVLTPLVASVLLWFLSDLEFERKRIQESLAAAKQRRRRHEPLDPFSRARERQEQEIQTKAITTRRLRQKPKMPEPAAPRRLRSLENRTPATLIMGC
jgi:uncharacterized protein YdaU (DUF1376 family)